MPSDAALLGLTVNMLAPMLATVSSMAIDAPLLSSITEITDATPMITPSIVSDVRNRFRRKADTAPETDLVVDSTEPLLFVEGRIAWWFFSVCEMCEAL